MRMWELTVAQGLSSLASGPILSVLGSLESRCADPLAASEAIET